MRSCPRCGDSLAAATNRANTDTGGEFSTMRLTVYELHERREEISTLECIGALQEAAFLLIFEFATSISTSFAPVQGKLT
jgi:hypothetical protein